MIAHRQSAFHALVMVTQGSADFLVGKRRVECPYAAESREAEQWCEGWDASARETGDQLKAYAGVILNLEAIERAMADAQFALRKFEHHKGLAPHEYASVRRALEAIHHALPIVRAPSGIDGKE